MEAVGFFLIKKRYGTDFDPTTTQLSLKKIEDGGVNCRCLVNSRYLPLQVMWYNATMSKWRIKGIIILIVALCIIGICTACGTSKTASQEDSNTVSTQQTTEAATEETVPGEDIQLTSNFTYTLPGPVEERFDFESTEGFHDDRSFWIEDGKVCVRSFLIIGEPNSYPRLVKLVYEGTDTEIHYEPFFDTEIAYAEDEIEDQNGEKMPRICYYWLDGSNTFCVLSFWAYDKEDLAVAEEVMANMKYKGKTAE